MYYVSIALFSAFGGVTRFGLSLLIGPHGFPYATLTANLSGCFLLAMVVPFLAEKKGIPRIIVAGFGTGFVGAFTTFSSFSLESIQLIQSEKYAFAAIYIGLSLFGGLLFAHSGYRISAFWLTKKGGGHDSD